MSDDCIICGKWPEADRWALREMLDTGCCRVLPTEIFMGQQLGGLGAP
jgi:hypothetical protein